MAFNFDRIACSICDLPSVITDTPNNDMLDKKLKRGNSWRQRNVGGKWE